MFDQTLLDAHTTVHQLQPVTSLKLTDSALATDLAPHERAFALLSRVDALLLVGRNVEAQVCVNSLADLWERAAQQSVDVEPLAVVDLFMHVRLLRTRIANATTSRDAARAVTAAHQLLVDHADNLTWNQRWAAGQTIANYHAMMGASGLEAAKGLVTCLDHDDVVAIARNANLVRSVIWSINPDPSRIWKQVLAEEAGPVERIRAGTVPVGLTQHRQLLAELSGGMADAWTKVRTTSEDTGDVDAASYQAARHACSVALSKLGSHPGVTWDTLVGTLQAVHAATDTDLWAGVDKPVVTNMTYIVRLFAKALLQFDNIEPEQRRFAAELLALIGDVVEDGDTTAFAERLTGT